MNKAKNQKRAALICAMKKLAQHYDRSKNRGGEVTYDPLGQNVNRIEYDLEVPWFNASEESLLNEEGAARKRESDPEYEAWFNEQQKSGPFSFKGYEGDPLSKDPELMSGDPLLESGLANDGNAAKDKDDDKEFDECPKCGCTCGKKKESARLNKLISVANKMKAALRG